MEVNRDVTVTFEIQGKQHVLRCKEGEAESLQRAAQKFGEYVDEMSGSTTTSYLSTDRVIVAVAVNVLDMLLKREQQLASLQKRIEHLNEKVSQFEHDLFRDAD